MEYQERPSSDVIKVGEINSKRASEEIGWLQDKFERQLKRLAPNSEEEQYVSAEEVYLLIRREAIGLASEFPFYEDVIVAANVISVVTPDLPAKRTIDVDNSGPLSPHAQDLITAAGVAIWVMSNELEKNGFEYNAGLHELSPENLAVQMNEIILQSYPDELWASRHRHSPGKRYMHGQDVRALSQIIVEDAHPAYIRHADYWRPLLKEHEELFSETDGSGKFYTRLGIGLAIAIMEGLEHHIVDEGDRRTLYLFLRELDELDDRGIEGVFDRR